MTGSRDVRPLLAIIDQAYDHRSWHGTNLRGSIRRITPAQVAWRPAQGRHSIWEIVVHTAYWKYAVWRRLTGERRGSFPLKGSDWFARPDEFDARAWHADVALLGHMHARLREAVAALPADRLGRRAPGSPFTFSDLVAGAAAHDLYHAGQIQLLKRLAVSPLSGASRPR
ncbi:MAG: DinB family protein [Vicinamibacteraceae bacterium]|nr:DinB family protein [Vicinamibacteraceae bacterium]MCL4846216.1 DinB family protein [Acidobacteriota bacterium]